MLKKKTPGLTPAPGLDPSQDELDDVFNTAAKPFTVFESICRWLSGMEFQCGPGSARLILATETLVTSTSDRVEVATWPMGSRTRYCMFQPGYFFEPQHVVSRFTTTGRASGGTRLSPRRRKFQSEIRRSCSANFSMPVIHMQQTGVLFSPSLRIGTLQLVLVAVLGIWLAFYRFGPAEDVSTLQRRSLTESAQAVGNLQYRLNDGGAVIRSYLEYIRSQLRRRYGSIVRLDQPESLAHRAGWMSDEVRTRLAEAQTLAETVQLSSDKTASSLRWLAILQHRLSGTRERNQMIFNDAACQAGLDSCTLDIHVRQAFPDVHQQKCFCCREHNTLLSCSVLNASFMAGRLCEACFTPDGMVQQSYILQQLTQISPC